jgi:hypothetical protein
MDAVGTVGGKSLKAALVPQELKLWRKLQNEMAEPSEAKQVGARQLKWHQNQLLNK